MPNQPNTMSPEDSNLQKQEVMLEPESFELYLKWREANAIEAARLDWLPSNSYGDQGGIHSELLGYLRWCKQAREKEEK